FRSTDSRKIESLRASASQYPGASARRHHPQPCNLIMKRIFSLNDFEQPARRKLPRQLFSYIYNGADEERTMKDNRKAFDRYAFVPRLLTGVSEREQKITLFGQEYASPFGISPVGLSAMWCYRGDVVLAEAAQENNIPAVMSGA